MRFKITLLISLLYLCLNAQVGIGTESPNATLEIKSSNQATPSNADGLIIPKADVFPASNPGVNQDGMMIFITGEGSPAKGFYSWDNDAAKWRRLSPSGLESLDEGSGQAWRLIREASSSHAPLGNSALDLSFSDNSSGALGNYSTVMGYNTIATNTASVAFGNNTIATGEFSISGGINNQATGYASAALNRNTRADAYSSFAVGSYNIGSGNRTQWIATDPIFEVGNGTTFNARSNALTILKNGKILAPSLSTGEITEAKSLITKEYADANYVQNLEGLEMVNEGNGFGWRLVGRDPVYYESIGALAIDLSISDQIFTPPPPPIVTQEVGNGASGLSSFATGYNTSAVGSYSFAAGFFTKSRCIGCTAIGVYNVGSGDPAINASDDPLFEIGNGTGPAGRSNAFTVLRNGYVGIGTHVPAYPLHITSSVSGLNSFPAHYLHHTIGVGSSGSGWTYGIGVSAGIFSSLGFATGSDERIKNVVGQSNGNEDLETLSKIQITDYTFKDYKKRGHQVTKKVIAQQVRSVYPKAVNLSSNFIPNIYQVAKMASVSNKNALLTFDKTVEVSVGEVLKVLDESDNEFYVTINEVKKNSVKVSTELPFDNVDEVFVYGKKVDDFHNVDYDAISMLNVSATQELYKRVKELEAQNKALKEDFDQRLSQLEALVSPKQ